MQKVDIDLFEKARVIYNADYATLGSLAEDISYFEIDTELVFRTYSELEFKHIDGGAPNLFLKKNQDIIVDNEIRDAYSDERALAILFAFAAVDSDISLYLKENND